MSDSGGTKSIDCPASAKLQDLLEAVQKAQISVEEIRQALLDAEHGLRKLQRMHQAIPAGGPIDLAEAEWNVRTEVHGAHSRMKRLTDDMDDLLPVLYGEKV